MLFVCAGLWSDDLWNFVFRAQLNILAKQTAKVFEPGRCLSFFLTLVTWSCTFRSGSLCQNSVHVCMSVTMPRITGTAHSPFKWLILYKFWNLHHKEVQQQQLGHQSLNVCPIRARILRHLHHDSFDYHFTPFRGCVWKCSPSASPWDTRPPPPLAQSACWGVSAGWKLDKAPPISQPPTLPALSHSLTTPIIISVRGLALEQEGGASVF